MTFRYWGQRLLSSRVVQSRKFECHHPHDVIAVKQVTPALYLRLTPQGRRRIVSVRLPLICGIRLKWIADMLEKPYRQILALLVDFELIT
jgi:hypothetical protein